MGKLVLNRQEGQKTILETPDGHTIIISHEQWKSKSIRLAIECSDRNVNIYREEAKDIRKRSECAQS